MTISQANKTVIKRLLWSSLVKLSSFYLKNFFSLSLLRKTFFKINLGQNQTAAATPAIASSYSFCYAVALRTVAAGCSSLIAQPARRF